jgi:Holliday junction resolvase RusA-like endonuclease
MAGWDEQWLRGHKAKGITRVERARAPAAASFGTFHNDIAPRVECRVVELALPMPPSANELYANGGAHGGRIKSEIYAEWTTRAGWTLLAQKPGRIVGKYEMELQVARPAKHIRADVCNREKAVSDLLVKHRVLQDDSLAERVTIEWADHIEGVRVVLRKFDEAAA